MKPWSQLSERRKASFTEQFKASGASCVNGAAGWYHQKCFKRNWQRSKPTVKVSRFRLVGEITAPDEAPETLTIDDLKDIFA